MSVPRGTTPTFTLTFDDKYDLTAARNVYVTFGMLGRVLTKTGSDLEVTKTTIAVYLTQKETLAFGEGFVEIQANWTDAFGGRVSSKVATYEITKQLLAKVVE